MKHTCIRYMGDLDQHGLAILARLRGWLPGVQSVLMDRPVAECFEHLAIADPTREIPCPAEGLTGSECLLEPAYQAPPVGSFRQEIKVVNFVR